MSLVAWYPLNGDIKDHGPNGYHLTYASNNGKLTTSASGKIGQCYEATATGYSDYLKTQVNIPAIHGELSMCCWAYVTATPADSANGLISNHKHGSNSGFGITVKQVSATDYRISCSTGNGTNRTYNTHYGTTNIKGAWHHLALTYDETSFSLWVDGVVEKTVTYSNYAIDDIFGIFKWSTSYNGTEYSVACKLNDVRLYDHCLSTKEVKELAKCLVLHYPFDQSLAYTNIAKNKTYSIYNNYSVPATLTKLSEKYQGCDIYRLSMTPTSEKLSDFQTNLRAHGIYGFSQSWEANTKYAFWIYYRPVTHSDIRVGGVASNINGWTEIAPHYYKDGWYRVGQYRSGSATTAATDSIFTSIMTPTAVADKPIIIDFCCPHLVQGITAPLEEDWYQDNTDLVVYDTSGYSKNGTVTSASAPYSVQGETPIYNSCYYFPNKTQYIQTSTLPTSGLANSYSISWWGKTSDYTSTMAWSFSNGNKLNFYQGLYCNTGDGSQNPYQKNGAIISTPSVNVWHHFVMVGDGTSNKLYVDGVLYGTAKTYKSITGTKIHFNGWDTGTSYKWNGHLSDFRIYATVLSEEDIIDLYTTRGSIDNQGDIFIKEINETNDSANLIYNSDFSEGTVGWKNVTLVQDETMGQCAKISTSWHSDLLAYNIPINSNDTYVFEYDIKCVTKSTNTSSRLSSFRSLDTSKVNVEVNKVNKSATGTETTLAVDLKSGDTTATLTSATNWNTSTTAYKKQIGICDHPAWGYNRSSKNISYDSISGNVLTLTAAYSGTTIPAGTKVANFADGGTFFYPTNMTATIPTTWTHYSKTIVGKNIRYSTAYINPGLLLYGDVAYVKNMSLKNTTNPQTCPYSPIASNISKNGIFNTNELLNVGLPVRYVKCTLSDGSSANSSHHFEQIKVLNLANENVAFNKKASVNGGGYGYTILTDGNTSHKSDYINASSVIIDLEFVDFVTAVQVWHYWQDGRTYNNSTVSVSTDGTNWITIFSTAKDGKYAESASGKTILVQDKKTSLHKLGSTISNNIHES